MTLKERIRRWFRENPGSELTRQELMEKFGCNLPTLRYHLSCMVDEGLIVRTPPAARFKAAEKQGA